jgi:DNA-binding MarR family transcriptional regulator
VSGKETKKGADPSLLPKLNDKTVVMKDFTTILTMRSENQAEVLSQFREIYDGKYSKGFGTGKEFQWEGHIGLIAACTPVYDKHYSVIGSLGDRFMLYRIENTKEEAVGRIAQRMVGQEQKMRSEIRGAIHRFLDQFKNLGDIQFDQIESVNQDIVTLACFCAYARCPVDRNRWNQTVEYLPQPEGPARLVKQFMQLGMALALINGKNVIDDPIYEILKKAGRDLISAQRLSILKYLWDEEIFEYMKEWRATKEISDALNMPATTVKLLLEDLMIVGLVNRMRSGDGETAPYRWQWSQKGYDMAAGAKVFEAGADEV